MLKLGTLMALTCCITACATTQGVIDLGEPPVTIEQQQEIEPELHWPVIGAVVTQKFRPKPKGHRRRHQGIDLAGPKNTPIHSVDHGIVVYAGSGYSGYGRLVIIEHFDTRYQSFYAHLNKFEVKRGDIVKKGDLLGLMGRSGRASGIHLHFEIRKNSLALNPLDLLPQSTTASKQAVP